MHHPYLQSNLCDIQVLRNFGKRLLRFRCRPATFIDQDLCDSLAQIGLYPRQTTARSRFVYTQNCARLTQTQVVEVVKFNQQTIFCCQFLNGSVKRLLHAGLSETIRHRLFRRRNGGEHCLTITDT